MDGQLTISRTAKTERYALVGTQQAALLVDIDTGAIFALNESAYLVWKHYLNGATLDWIATSLAARYKIAPQTAWRDVQAAIAPQIEVGHSVPTSEFTYARGSSGYVLSFQGFPIFEIAESGDSLRALDFTRNRPELARRLLQAAVPKLLALRGHFVLHASAVETDCGVIAFSGPSGAGKTSTARAFVRAGANLICEDKLLLLPRHGGAVDAVLAGESGLQSWIETAADDLLVGRSVSSQELLALFETRCAPLRQIGFLAVSRRNTPAIVARRLSLGDAASAIFQNSFLGSNEPTTWIRQLERSLGIAGSIEMFDLTMPDGLRSLDEATASIAQSKIPLKDRSFR